MMAMLVRAGLPSRKAAQAAIQETAPNFVTLAEMREWLATDEIKSLSEKTDWPTQETASIWRRFRNDILAAPFRKLNEQHWQLKTTAPQSANATHPARIRVDLQSRAVTVESPDYYEIIRIKQRLLEEQPSLIRVDFAKDGQSATISRIGRGTARWY
jgi:hypothetical protein